MSKRVKICGIPYEIKYVTDDFTSDAVHFGEANFLEQVIKVNEKLTGELRDETTVHEILHVILVHIGRDDLSNDEVFVQSLANAVFQTFKVKEEPEVVRLKSTVKPETYPRTESFKDLLTKSLNNLEEVWKA